MEEDARDHLGLCKVGASGTSSFVTMFTLTEQYPGAVRSYNVDPIHSAVDVHKPDAILSARDGKPPASHMGNEAVLSRCVASTFTAYWGFSFVSTEASFCLQGDRFLTTLWPSCAGQPHQCCSRFACCRCSS